MKLLDWFYARCHAERGESTLASGPSVRLWRWGIVVT